MELLLMTAKAVAKWEPTSAGAVLEQLSLARDWLREQTRLADVQDVLPQAEAIRLLVCKRDLGRDAELAAAEIVRRVERRLAELIQQGQEDGTVATRSDNAKRTRDPDLILPKDVFLNNHSAQTDATKMAAVNDDDFEEALAAARAEGNMSRAAVLRKVNGQPTRKPSKRGEWHAKKRHLDPVRIVTESLATLQGVAAGLSLIAPEDVTDTARKEWAREMRDALVTIEAFRKGLARP